MRAQNLEDGAAVSPGGEFPQRFEDREEGLDVAQFAHGAADGDGDAALAGTGNGAEKRLGQSRFADTRLAAHESHASGTAPDFGEGAIQRTERVGPVREGPTDGPGALITPQHLPAQRDT